MKKTWLLGVFLTLATVTSACGSEGTNSAASGSDTPSERECDTGGAIVDWVDFLMINDITYQRYYREGNEEPAPDFEKGKKIGETTFMLADCAPPEHISENGDAAFLEAGTPIYEVKGYPSKLMVVADGKLYITDRNQEAETVADLFPVEGKVKALHFQSTEDGSRFHTFSEENKEAFLNYFLKQELFDPASLWKGEGMKGERIFIEMELDNAASFRLVYWPESNVFSTGANGTEQIGEIIEEEKNRAAETE